MPKRKSSSKRSSNSKRRSRKSSMSRKAIKRSVLQAVLGMSETKYRQFEDENVNIFHNTTTITGNAINMLQTSQGASDNQRIGDTIRAKSLNIKMQLFNKQDRPNVTYRILILAPLTTGVTPAPSIWKGESGNKMLDNIDTGSYKIIYQKYVKWSGQTTTFSGPTTLPNYSRETSKILSINIPLKNKKLQYSTNSGLVPKSSKMNWTLYVTPYDAFGTLITDNIASYAYNARFYFKDF